MKVKRTVHKFRNTGLPGGAGSFVGNGQRLSKKSGFGDFLGCGRG